MKCKYCEIELFGGEITEYPKGVCDTCNLGEPTTKQEREYRQSEEAQRENKEALDSFFSKIVL